MPAPGTGSDPEALTRAAEAAALQGRSEQALLLADEVLATSATAGPDALARCVVVAATVLAHRSLLPRSADLYRWSADARTGAAPFAVLAFAGVGDREAALAASTGASPAAPTLLAGASHLMAEGVLESLRPGGGPRALTSLSAASALLETSGRPLVLPDTPAALAAVVALHVGESEAAGAVLRRAIAAGQGGASAQPRHHGLLALTAVLDGALPAAQAHAADARAVAPGGDLEPRDAVLLAAVDVGVARRAGDLAALAPATARARQLLIVHPPDLYSLLPLGEVLVGAARLGQQQLVRPHLDRAHELLEALGRPATWCAPLVFSQVQAAVLGGAEGGMTGRAGDGDQALVDDLRATTDDRAGDRAGVAFAAAAQCWLDLTRGVIDASAVQQASSALAGIGRRWDASRLAGQAAVRTADRSAMAALLACARSLAAVADVERRDGAPHGEAAAAAAPSSARVGGETGRAGPGMTLSDKERQVAELLVAGNTYREVGERLYISPKTVEHQVARMRQRLGAAGRSELLGQLRLLLQTQGR